MNVFDTDVYKALTELIVMSEEEDGIYLYNFNTGREYTTNNTGKEILELCGDKTVKEIAEILAERHEGDFDFVLQDVKNFLEMALEAGFVEKGDTE